MCSKSLLKRKTFWAGLGSIATGIGMIVVGQVPEGIQMIGGGVLAIFMRDGIEKVAKAL